jgi:acyl-CoA synthetase (AMP-forming)/AMP-acid ligase II
MTALILEKCTHMGAVPTLIHAMIRHPQFPGNDMLALRYISIGGSVVTEDDINLCKRFGAKNAITAFGMTEGSPITAFLRSDPLLEDGFHPGVGKVLAGSRIRICPPASKDVLKRNEIGELHVSGSGVIQSYLDDVGNDSFYVDDVGSWLITGDQAYIDQNDVLHIIGRLKDIIIRGGENIAPAKIEDCLRRTLGIIVSVLLNLQV